MLLPALFRINVALGRTRWLEKLFAIICLISTSCWWAPQPNVYHSKYKVASCLTTIITTAGTLLIAHHSNQVEGIKMNLGIAKSGSNVNLWLFLIHFKNICAITPSQLPIKLQSMLIKTRQKLTPPYLYFYSATQKDEWVLSNFTFSSLDLPLNSWRQREQKQIKRIRALSLVWRGDRLPQHISITHASLPLYATLSRNLVIKPLSV